jgi:hypothetical protein
MLVLQCLSDAQRAEWALHSVEEGSAAETFMDEITDVAIRSSWTQAEDGQPHNAMLFS